MSKEALKLALEALEKPHPGIRTSFTDALTYRETVKQAITALQEALAEQPAQQEPVAEGEERKAFELYWQNKHDNRRYCESAFEGWKARAIEAKLKENP